MFLFSWADASARCQIYLKTVISHIYHTPHRYTYEHGAAASAMCITDITMSSALNAAILQAQIDLTRG